MLTSSPGIVRLQAAAKGARQADGGVGFFNHRHFLRAVDQVGVEQTFATAATTSEVSPLRTNAMSSLVTSSLSVFAQVADSPVFNPLIGGFVGRHPESGASRSPLPKESPDCYEYRRPSYRRAPASPPRRELSAATPASTSPRTVRWLQHLFYILKLINIAEQCGL